MKCRRCSMTSQKTFPETLKPAPAKWGGGRARVWLRQTKGGHAIALIDIGTLIKVVPLYFVGEGSVQGQNRYTDRSVWHCSVLCRGGYAIAWIGNWYADLSGTIVVGEGPGKYSRDKIDTLIDACCTALCYVGEDTPRLGDQGGTIVFCRGGIREG